MNLRQPPRAIDSFDGAAVAQQLGGARRGRRNPPILLGARTEKISAMCASSVRPSARPSVRLSLSLSCLTFSPKFQLSGQRAREKSFKLPRYAAAAAAMAFMLLLSNAARE